MARLRSQKKKMKKLVALFSLWIEILNMVNWFIQLLGVVSLRSRVREPRPRYTIICPERAKDVERLLYRCDKTCHDQLRMNRLAFAKLCAILNTKGQLKASKYLEIDEQVAIFLHVLGHHVKNRVVKFKFRRSGETISKYFNSVLNAVLRLEGELLKKPEPVAENSTDDKWKWFKGCLGALDGTYIEVNVPEEDKPRYRNRKGDITTNVLACCSPDMKFIYVLPGWEGSAADGRILRNAMLRPNGLKVPRGNYYLVDAGYTNGEGFLAPFRGQRYHLNDWSRQPEKAEEYFNMKHSSARNVIERCFGVIKKRWAILRSPSFYPIKTQNKIILACCLIHNFLRNEMPDDMLDEEEDENEIVDNTNNAGNGGEGYVEHINTIGTSNAWTQFRSNLATSMFEEWKARHS